MEWLFPTLETFRLILSDVGSVHYNATTNFYYNWEGYSQLPDHLV